MSSLVNWFHKRRSLSEVSMKNTMSINGAFGQMTVANNGRSGQGGRNKVLKKQMSLPSQSNYAYFYLQPDEDDVLLGDLDLVYPGTSIDVIFGYKPFWKVQRRYSENSHLNSPVFHGAQWQQHAPFGRRVPTSPGLVLDIAHTQKRRQVEKVARRKSDSLFNYVPKAFSEHDASRILFGEKRDEALASRPSCSSQRLRSRTEMKPRQLGVETGSQEQKKNNDNVKRLPQKTFSPEKQPQLEKQPYLEKQPHLEKQFHLDKQPVRNVPESLDLNQNLPDGHFYFSPSMLLDNCRETVYCKSSFTNIIDGDLSHMTDKDYNINCKSADDEVSTILSEFQNIDQSKGNNNNNNESNAGKREFLY